MQSPLQSQPTPEAPPEVRSLAEKDKGDTEEGRKRQRKMQTDRKVQRQMGQGGAER